MANVEIKVFENISPREKEIFNEFIVSNWGEKLGGNGLDYFDTPRLWVIGYRNGRIVGLFLVYDREIMFEGKYINMAGVGGVVTRIDCRRVGVMSQMLRKFFANYLPKYKFDIAMLCTDVPKLGKLYGQVGFVPLNKPYYFLDKNGVEKEETGGMMVGLNNKKIVTQILLSKEKLFVGESNF